MNDILDREINEGDLLIVKGTGRYNKGLRLGIMYNNSVRFEDLSFSTYCEAYKIENPTIEETKIKDFIVSKMKERELIKKNTTYLKLKELKINYIYKTEGGNKYVYLGKYKNGFVKIWNYSVTYFDPYEWDSKKYNYPKPEITISAPKFVEEIGLSDTEKITHILNVWINKEIISL